MPDFPTTAELTDFTGGAENPLSENGAWEQYGREPLRRDGTGNAMPTVEFVVNGMYWTRTVFRPTCEVWGCVAGGGLGAALEGWRVVFWADSPTSRTGYLSGFGGGIGEEYYARRYDGGSFDNFTTLGTLDTTEPTKLGLRITPTHVEQWGEISGVWTLIQSFADTTYRGIFYAAIELEEQGGINELGFGCFGGGLKNRQHFIRWKPTGIRPKVPA